jgi:DNA invertase Pin-like site-specific DNA recombinase
MRVAYGIVRVSRRAGREGDSFVSPADQRRRIGDVCEREGLTLQLVVEEIDISGGAPLTKRDGLREGVEAIEAGSAEVLVVAYFDRLVRSLRVQGEVVSRVEAAGGQVLTVDVGAVSEKTASQWLSGTLLGAVNEYQRRTAAERSHSAQADAVARGVPPFPSYPPGLARTEAGPLAPTAEAPLVIEAYEMRADGITIDAVRQFMADNGVALSYRGVQSMLCSRLYLGEIHFGSLVNLKAHKPVIDRDLWKRVQRVKVSRGRRPKSDALLARLGVLQCGSCGARMVIGTVRDGSYPFYRCPPTGDCVQRVTISAAKAEAQVAEAVKAALADVEGRASVEQNARQAEVDAEQAQADLDAAIRAFSGIADEEAAQQRLAELRTARDEALEQAEQLGGLGGVVALTGADWDRLALAGKRDLIRATVERATVAPGRGTDRVDIHLFVE